MSYLGNLGMNYSWSKKLVLAVTVVGFAGHDGSNFVFVCKR